MSGDGRDTIYALSSGTPPAAIAVVRISGPRAEQTFQQLCGSAPPPRRARLATLRCPNSGEQLDRALVLFFPGPGSATGEDLAELHLHGGRSVVAVVLDTLRKLDGLRPAEPGEFTRRSFDNGRIDLAEAEGLADLLAAETESQRRAALTLAQGALSRRVGDWQDHILALAAAVEARLDFADEDDVDAALPDSWHERLQEVTSDMALLLAKPPIERLREGVKVVIAGPPNAGKSSLLNGLVGRDAAITSAVAGTTRDLIEAPTSIAGLPFLFTDTAGLRDVDDEVEAIGIGRARDRLAQADIILWLGVPSECPDAQRSINVQSKADLYSEPVPGADLLLSPVTGQGMDRLVSLLLDRAVDLLPHEGEVTINARHRAAIVAAVEGLELASEVDDLLIVAEALRSCRSALDRITGRGGVEEMLDSLFGRFCIGK